MGTSWRKRAGALVSLVAGPLMIYFALPIAITSGLPAVLITIFLIAAEIITGLFLAYESRPKLWIESLTLSGAIVVIVGLIFLTPLTLELKLLIGVLMLVIVFILARFHNARHKRKI